MTLSLIDVWFKHNHRMVPTGVSGQAIREHLNIPDDENLWLECREDGDDTCLDSLPLVHLEAGDFLYVVVKQ